MTKKITPPKGWPKDKPWTEKDAAEATAAAGLGLSRSDFSDDGADLQDLGPFYTKWKKRLSQSIP